MGKNAHLEMDTRVLKRAFKNASVSKKCRRLFKALIDSMSVRFNKEKKKTLQISTFVYSGMREPLACRSVC